MHHKNSLGGHQRKLRQGLSLFESIACLVALIGGVTLGTMYLGIDLKRVVLDALEDSGAEDASALGADEQTSTPASEAKKASDQQVDVEAQDDSNGPGADGDSAAAEADGRDSRPAAATEAHAVATSKQTPLAADSTGVEKAPVAANRSPLRAPQSTQFSNWVASLSEESMLTDQQRIALSVAYWATLIECLDVEGASRDAMLKELESLQLFDYLSHRQAQHRLTADKIAELNRFGIDPRVSAFGAKSHQWQQAGAELYARALRLLTDAPSAQLSGPFAQSWQSAATQHRMEERLLQEKRKAVENYIRHLSGDENFAAESSAHE